jgi:hypothetical protein
MQQILKTAFTWGRNVRGGTPMATIQSVIFGMMLYSMPSFFLMALLVCRQGFDPDPNVVGRGF